MTKAANLAALAQGPAFSAYKSGSNQSMTGNTATLITFESKDFDTNTCYNNTGSTATLNGLSAPAYSFCPNVAGYYWITSFIEKNNANSNYSVGYIYKNGAKVASGANYPTSATAGPINLVTYLVYLNGTGDYVQIYAQEQNNSTVFYGQVITKFCASLARAA